MTTPLKTPKLIELIDFAAKGLVEKLDSDDPKVQRFQGTREFFNGLLIEYRQDDDGAWFFYHCGPSPTFPFQRWFYNESVDLERWLPCITTSPLEGQDNLAYSEPEALVCAFDSEYKPTAKAGHLLAASNEMLHALQVISLDPRISAWLEQNDPMALRQVREALTHAKGKP